MACGAWFVVSDAAESRARLLTGARAAALRSAVCLAPNTWRTKTALVCREWFKVSDAAQRWGARAAVRRKGTLLEDAFVRRPVAA